MKKLMFVFFMLVGIASVCVAENSSPSVGWGGTWEYLGGQGIGTDQAALPSLALDSAGNPTVAYIGNAYVSGHLSVLHWDGDSWQYMGPPEIGNSVNDVSLALNGSGYPPIVGYTNGNLSILRWDGSAWQYVGSPEIVDATSLSLAVDSTNNLVVAVVHGDEHELSVLRWDGRSHWEKLGKDMPAVGFHPSLALDSAGNPVVAYEDEANNDKLSVLRWDGSAWQYMGAPGVSEYNVWFPSLKLDSSGNPIVAYGMNVNEHAEEPDEVSVLRWDGNSWQYVGSPQISDGAAGPASLMLDTNGAPVVACQNWKWQYSANGDSKLAVLRWDGRAWEYIGPRGIAYGAWVSLALDTSGYPIIGYEDWTTEDDKLSVLLYNGPQNGTKYSPKAQ